MKLAYLQYKNFSNNKDTNREDHLNLVLESVDDVVKYYGWCGNNNGRKLMEAWDDIVDNVERGQEPWSHLPWDPIYLIAGVLSNKNMKERPYSLVELAVDYDHIVHEKIQTMIGWINDGMEVRVNHLGGTSPMTIFEVEEEVQANEDVIKQYLISGNINEGGIPTIDMRGASTIIIENDRYISKKLHDYLKDVGLSTSGGDKNYRIMDSFKSKTEFIKMESMYKLFQSFIDSGVTHIITETTGGDAMQVHRVKKALKKVLGDNPDVKFKVTVLLNDKEKKDLFDIRGINVDIEVI